MGSDQPQEALKASPWLKNLKKAQASSGAHSPQLFQDKSSILGQGPGLLQLGKDVLAGAILLHEAALHHGPQLLLLGHLAPHGLHLLTALQWERKRWGGRASGPGGRMVQGTQGQVPPHPLSLPS